MHWPSVIRSQVLSGLGFFVFICVLMCLVLMEMLGRGLVNPRVREWLLFLVLLCPALFLFALPDQIQSQAFYRPGFPSGCTLLHKHHVQHLIVRDNSSHLGGCSSDEQREMQEMGRRGGVFALGPNVLWCSSAWGLFFFSYYDSEALNEIYLL